jgi:hypothetical protein
MFGSVSDDFDRLSDDALLSYLTGAAVESDMRLVIEERNGEWFAESRSPSGLGGEMVVLGANGPDRRRACCGSRNCSPTAADLNAQ